MNQGKYIFAQLTDFLPRRQFDSITAKYCGNKYVKSFTCWNQMLYMIFGQLTARDNMRDLMLALEAHQSKCYHLGFGFTVTHTNLGKANRNRNWKIFEEFAHLLIENARQSYYKTDFEIAVEGNVYAFDSSTIDLCLSVFWWAEFRKYKGGIKLHTLYDVKTSISGFMLITPAKLHDVNAMDWLHYESGSFYIFDRGYVDFSRLYRIDQSEAWFVVCGKDNLQLRMYSNKVDRPAGIHSDQIGKLVTPKALKDYPDKIRKITFYDVEQDREFVFITNNFEIEAAEIALLYKKRWVVELFFKWIKQHLRVNSFWSTTMNAVKIQVYCAIITYCLVAIVANKLKVECPIYENLQILGVSLLDRAPVNEILTEYGCKRVKELSYKQLKISWE